MSHIYITTATAGAVLNKPIPISESLIPTIEAMKAAEKFTASVSDIEALEPGTCIQLRFSTETERGRLRVITSRAREATGKNYAFKSVGDTAVIACIGGEYVRQKAPPRKKRTRSRS